MRKSVKILALLLFQYFIYNYWPRDYPSIFDFIKSLDTLWALLGFILGLGMTYVLSDFKK